MSTCLADCKTKPNNQTVERFACQTEEQTCCKKAQRDVRMLKRNRWGIWRRARYQWEGAGGKMGGRQVGQVDNYRCKIVDLTPVLD